MFFRTTTSEFGLRSAICTDFQIFPTKLPAIELPHHGVLMQVWARGIAGAVLIWARNKKNAGRRPLSLSSARFETGQRELLDFYRLRQRKRQTRFGRIVDLLT